jgi:hypothetical protein
MKKECQELNELTGGKTREERERESARKWRKEWNESMKASNERWERLNKLEKDEEWWNRSG